MKNAALVWSDDQNHRAELSGNREAESPMVLAQRWVPTVVYVASKELQPDVSLLEWTGENPDASCDIDTVQNERATDSEQVTGSPKIVVVAHAQFSDRTEWIVDGLAMHGFAIVLLSSTEHKRELDQCPAAVVACLVNDGEAGARLNQLIQQVACNKEKSIVLMDSADEHLRNLLVNRGFSVISASILAEAELLIQKIEGPCVVFADNLSEQSNHNNELQDFSNVFLDPGFTAAWLARVTTSSPVFRSLCLSNGVSQIFGAEGSEDEIIHAVNRLFGVQSQYLKSMRCEYKDSSNGIRNENYLNDVGARLYSLAKRGNISFSIAVIALADVNEPPDSTGHASVRGVFASRLRLSNLSKSSDIEMHSFLQTTIDAHLRSSDVLIQCADGRLLCLMCGRDRTALSNILSRLQCEFEMLVDQSSHRVELVVGATQELGTTLEGMIQRATMALHQSHHDSSGISIL